MNVQTPVDPQHALEKRLRDTRQLSNDLVEPLSPEDMTVQASEDASSTKWHLAHVTWFFETFVLAAYLPRYRIFDESFAYCFNSYYESLGPRQPRSRRGVLTRPSMARVMEYRAHVDEGLAALFAQGIARDESVARIIETGINHEQQHQELLLVDVLALFAANPLRPAYRTLRSARPEPESDDTAGWLDFPGGIRKVGHDGSGFAWDNEEPRHDVLLRPYQLADRLVTNGEWLDFMADGGYRTAALWLADGWATVNRQGWDAPLHWERREDYWLAMTLYGPLPVDRAAPVSYVSDYAADAFARWAGKRLPTEFEWEVAAEGLPVTGNTLASGALRPLPAPTSDGLPRQMFGDVWEWTQSAYTPYPGYRPPAGAIGEYNGKFMVSQQVLRGGSFATPLGHTRATYRNFFYPQQRRQFVGLRLASECT